MYYCKRCKCAKAPQRVNGKDKVRGFRSGFVARFLECGHSVPVTQPHEGMTPERPNLEQLRRDVQRLYEINRQMAAS